MDYKATVHLPETSFPMKADLPRREPDILAFWKQHDIYQKMRAQASGRPTFILADGPPYANGSIHIGHAVNKVLKDIVVKSQRLSGKDAPYTPGWDCHGLPIEHQIEKTHGRVGKKLDANAFRKACREFAAAQVEGQRQDFERLGVLGDWQRPYLTMLPRYEAMQLRGFGVIYNRGHLVKGFKPVHWCIDCRSSLAEAEVEYADHVSQSVYVSYPVVSTDDLLSRVAHALDHATQAELKAAGARVLIWTTTPWTLPASLAVTVHPELDYVLLKDAHGWALVAEGLVEAVQKQRGLDALEKTPSFKGAVLEHLHLQHPFYARVLPVICGEHVTLDAGTGCVHTAPGHGADDYQVGKRYGLEVLNPVGDDGRYLPSVESPEGATLAGLLVVGKGDKRAEANEAVIALLTQADRLWGPARDFKHSYPHCWRHKSPVIFRATPQWFISMEKAGLRQKALEEIRRVAFTPSWGEQRIYNMIEGRPDWCVSRQRTWGVPIPLFLHKETGEPHPNTSELIERAALRVEQEGIEGWFNLDVREWLGADADHYTQSTDVMDVWVDSGMMHYCVSNIYPEITAPADLYLEGSDQHRGWFHSSLLTSVAMFERAPYRGVLTHGFTVDEHGHKMSKSKGNVVVPQKVIDSLGADVLRLWIASTDYASEMSVSDNILKRAADAYRRMRNTLRYFLGNLAGFDPSTESLPAQDLLALDQWVMYKAKTLHDELVEAYHTYQFHLVYQKLYHFCVVDLGSFYLDVLKDRLYTTQKTSRERRSAQTALWHLAQAMVRWLAPITSMTAEEAYQLLPKGSADPISVMLATWHDLPSVPEPDSIWDVLLTVRADVTKVLEGLRANKEMGASLEASVTLYVEPKALAALEPMRDELHFVFITSGLQLKPLAEAPAEAHSCTVEGFKVVAHRAEGTKCVRCWHVLPAVGTHAEHAELCPRCVSNVAGSGEIRVYL